MAHTERDVDHQRVVDALTAAAAADDFDIVRRLLADGVVLDLPTGPVIGIDAVVRRLERLRAVAPGEVTIEETVADGRRLAVRICVGERSAGLFLTLDDDGHIAVVTIV
jgi:hypothetical protein